MAARTLASASRRSAPSAPQPGTDPAGARAPGDRRLPRAARSPGARAHLFTSQAISIPTMPPASPRPSALEPDPRRLDAMQPLIAELRPGRRVALSTHMNADGDGCGSEAALARLLTARGMDVRVV